MICKELSVTIGAIPPVVFYHAPRLRSLTALHTVVAPAVHSKLGDSCHGPVSLDDLTHSLKGISTANLLCLLEDSPRQALALTDRAGSICVVSAAMEKITGYSAAELCGRTFLSLTGSLTDTSELRRLEECLALQDAPVCSTTFLHRADKTVYLAQVLIIPNVLVHQGLPLEQHCLSLEYLEQLALEIQEGSGTSGNTGTSSGSGSGSGGRSGQNRISKYIKHSDNIKDFIHGIREHHYHLIRLGALSHYFQPDPQSIV